MADLNLLDNRPLARAALWFLVDAGIVLAALCGAMLYPDLIPDFFDHGPLLRIGVIAMTILFALLALTSSALGFLANCKPGRTTGGLAVVVLVLGLAAIGTLVYLGQLEAVNVR